MNTRKKQACEPLFFLLIFKGFQDMPPKRRSGYISGTIFTSFGNFVLGLGPVFTIKIY